MEAELIQSQNTFTTQNEPERSGSSVDSNKSTNTSSTSTIIYYLLIGVVGILVVALIVIFVYRHMNSKVDEIGYELEESRKENALLKTRVEQHENARANYIRRIDSLTKEIDDLTNEQSKQPFDTSLPMTQDSYDAPSPDQRPTKPSNVQNNEAIKAMINSPRRTVQDAPDCSVQ